MPDYSMPPTPGCCAKMRNNSDASVPLTSIDKGTMSGSIQARPDLAHENTSSTQSRKLSKRAPPWSSSRLPSSAKKNLLYLQPWHLIDAKQVSHEINNTIIGSIKLQRALLRKPDHRLVIGEAVERDIPQGRVTTRELKAIQAARPTPEGSLLKANPWLFCSVWGVRQPQLLCISNLMHRIIRSGPTVESFLEDMLITQPPIDHVEVECYFRPRGGTGDGPATSYWKCVVLGGIKVEDLVEHIQRKLRESAAGLGKIMDSPAAHIICIGLRDGYEVFEV